MNGKSDVEKTQELYKTLMRSSEFREESNAGDDDDDVKSHKGMEGVTLPNNLSSAIVPKNFHNPHQRYQTEYNHNPYSTMKQQSPAMETTHTTINPMFNEGTTHMFNEAGNNYDPPQPINRGNVMNNPQSFNPFMEQHPQSKMYNDDHLNYRSRSRSRRMGGLYANDVKSSTSSQSSKKSRSFGFGRFNNTNHSRNISRSVSRQSTISNTTLTADNVSVLRGMSEKEKLAIKEYLKAVMPNGGVETASQDIIAAIEAMRANGDGALPPDFEPRNFSLDDQTRMVYQSRAERDYQQRTANTRSTICSVARLVDFIEEKTSTDFDPDVRFGPEIEEAFDEGKFDSSIEPITEAIEGTFLSLPIVRGLSTFANIYSERSKKKAKRKERKEKKAAEERRIQESIAKRNAKKKRRGTSSRKNLHHPRPDSVEKRDPSAIIINEESDEESDGVPEWDIGNVISSM